MYLFNSTNLGRRLGFLVTGAAIFGWLSITSLLFVVYAPRGPKPDNIEGLNAFEIRVIPITFLLVSVVLFLVFLTALHQYEETQEGASLTT
jgi:heme/copper-type cytochrome/quinol oxidase subunit 2